jgi:N-methylhydantoinase A
VPYRVAIDIGGGFTDLFAIEEETGRTLWAKVETTPGKLSDGVLNVFRQSGIAPSECTQLLHGQTLVINTIVQRKGARVGLITTKGFRDILEIQRANRRDIFNLKYRKPEPFVPRYMRLEVDERTASDGKILKHVNKNEVEKVYLELKRLGTEAIAICFINSYANPENERIARESIPAEEKYVTISSEVSREWREYERTNTAVLNAYVMPILSGYIENLVDTFRRMGFKGSFYMMLSGGGVAPFEFARKVPISTVESGPVAGVVAGVKIGELIGEKNLIILDGGSTTTKASLVENLEVKFTTDYAIERDEFKPGYPVKVPVVDIVEIGNGGGSIAWIDELGSLRVGPVSAGADPGPACYGKGGKEPTLTDAYVIVGFLNPAYFLGGKFELKKDLAVKSLEKISKHFDITNEQAAFAIIRIANDNAAQLLRLISVQRGYDPRDFVLVAHGGAGPMIAPFIAEELEIKKVIVPTIPPGNFSAWGLLMSDLRYDVVKTVISLLDSKSIQSIFNEGYKELETELSSIFSSVTLSSNVLMLRYADLRYHGQEHTIRVSVPPGQLKEAEINYIRERFREGHLKEYGFALDEPVELVNLHLTAVLSVSKPTIKEMEVETNAKAEKGEREVFWGDSWTRTPVYERKLIRPGKKIDGPAIIEEETSTVVIKKGQSASIDRYGNVVIEVV